MPQTREFNKDVYGIIQPAVCPRCGKTHRLRENWTGRGVLRKFCPRCKATIERNQALSSDEPEHALFPPHYARNPVHYHEPKPVISEMSLIPHFR
jgi:ribosomal protein S27AE